MSTFDLPPSYVPEIPQNLPGYQPPIQGFGDVAAMALAKAPPMQLPNALAPGQSTGPGWLAHLLSGAAQGFAGARLPVIQQRSDVDKALAEAAHQKNLLAIQQSQEARKAATIDTKTAIDAGHPELAGKQTTDLTPDQLATLKPKPPKAGAVTMNDVLNSNGVLNMGDIDTPWDDPGIKQRVMGKQPEKPLPAYMTVLKEGDKQALAAQFRAGELDPGLLNLSGRGIAAPILAILSKPGPNGEPPWNEAKAKLQWDAMRALTRNSNSGDVLRLQRAAQSVQRATELMQSLNTQLTDAVQHAPIPRSEIPESNRISLAFALRGSYGPKALAIARQFETQAAVLRDAYPVVLSGGTAPLQSEVDDAKNMLDPMYGEGGTQAVLSTLMTDASYKIAAVHGIGVNTPGIEGANPYGASPQYAPQAAPLFPMSPGPAAAPAPSATPASAAQAEPSGAAAAPKARYQNARGTVQFDFEPGKAPKGWTLVRTTVKAHTRAVGGR